MPRLRVRLPGNGMQSAFPFHAAHRSPPTSHLLGSSATVHRSSTLDPSDQPTLPTFIQVEAHDPDPPIDQEYEEYMHEEYDDDSLYVPS